MVAGVIQTSYDIITNGYGEHLEVETEEGEFTEFMTLFYILKNEM